MNEGINNDDGAVSIGYGEHVPQLLQMAGHGGTAGFYSQQTVNWHNHTTVTPISKALTKTTNCTCRASTKYW